MHFYFDPTEYLTDEPADRGQVDHLVGGPKKPELPKKPEEPKEPRIIRPEDGILGKGVIQVNVKFPDEALVLMRDAHNHQPLIGMTILWGMILFSCITIKYVFGALRK